MKRKEVNICISEIRNLLRSIDRSFVPNHVYDKSSLVYRNAADIRYIADILCKSLTHQLMKKKVCFRQYLRCVIVYTDIQSVRVLHYAVSTDYVEDFTQMIKDTFVHPDISFTDIIYSPDSRQFFQLIQI